MFAPTSCSAPVCTLCKSKPEEQLLAIDLVFYYFWASVSMRSVSTDSVD